jgi:hypothetical protein
MLQDALKQAYRILALLFGVNLLAGPCITISKEDTWSTHTPPTVWPVLVGSALIVLSVLLHFLETRQSPSVNIGAGVDLSRIKESKGSFWTEVAGCEIRVVNGRLEEHAKDPHTIVVLTCNEYFDDKCADNTRSALGAYVNSTFRVKSRNLSR